jgi:hypothetical protein
VAPPVALMANKVVAIKVNRLAIILHLSMRLLSSEFE